MKNYRMVFKKTNRLTFFRVLSSYKQTIDEMLIKGMDLYGSTNSHHPRYPRCFPLFQQTHICPKCPESHLPAHARKRTITSILQGHPPGMVPFLSQIQREDQNPDEKQTSKAVFNVVTNHLSAQNFTVVREILKPI
ncbi:hypothetical protein GEV33_002212 [Tenebrio molitor]|uniref:Uncharacterized protein n=1 Tax=Tenebrio molitor TaxID=7067 RepID=A0A8J6HTX2_TENMO|nr:hypothetical protein GEV33_002212 [Tenebrio molitor]